MSGTGIGSLDFTLGYTTVPLVPSSYINLANGGAYNS